MGFRWLLASLQIALLARTAFAAFSLTESGNNFIVDTNAGLIFTVARNSGDVVSMKFNGIEAQDQGSKKSHIGSGIGASCSHWRGGNGNNYIKITCTAGSLTQFYVARYNDPAIHMATYISAEPSIGELRFIARLRKGAVPTGHRSAEIAGGSAIEGSDVFKVGSDTRSKFYSSRQFIDDNIHGVTGNGIGVWMIIPPQGYESNSGGPFMRDINNQGGDQQELYYNSGHTQTEAYRMGLHGPYTLWFTTGGQPSANIDLLFWEGLQVQGYVGRGARGRVTGRASGIASNFANLQTVGFSNGAAQYWARTDSSGAFTSPYMKPGTYTMTLYKVELAVATKQVSVSAGGVQPASIWQIGDWDGTPSWVQEMQTRSKLCSKISTVQFDNRKGYNDSLSSPSDGRMGLWGDPVSSNIERWTRRDRHVTVTYNVGDSLTNFPMAIFKGIGPVTIRFNLASNQLGARTLEIGVTLAFAGGRPQVQVNGWTGPSPPAPSQPDSRGFTRGTWRGNVTAGTLVAGTNTIVVNVISGSGGDMFL
ncbi:rhamnogalacturonase B [Coprinopsis sp. MPI-PUGE-AT-0042]|nr:rhamnogalacturonase B [Coprinopsis sp. MPI-PUGE-AT-0042]